METVQKEICYEKIIVSREELNEIKKITSQKAICPKCRKKEKTTYVGRDKFGNKFFNCTKEKNCGIFMVKENE